MSQEGVMPRIFLAGFGSGNSPPQSRILEPDESPNKDHKPILAYISKDREKENAQNNKSFGDAVAENDEQGDKMEDVGGKEDQTTKQKEEIRVQSREGTNERKTSEKEEKRSSYSYSNQDKGEDNGQINHVQRPDSRPFEDAGEDTSPMRKISRVMSDKETLAKTIEEIVEEKLHDRVEKMVEEAVDKRIETIMTDKDGTNPSEDFNDHGSPQRKPYSLQEKKINNMISVEQNDQRNFHKGNERQRPFSEKPSNGNNRNHTRFWEIEEKFERKKHNDFSNSPAKRKDSNKGFDDQPRHPAYIDTRMNTFSGIKNTNTSINDADRSSDLAIPSSALSYLGLEDKDTKFIINQFSDFMTTNKILQENLKYQSEKQRDPYKKDKAISIPKLYDVYLEKGQKQPYANQIEMNIRNHSPYVSNIHYKVPSYSYKSAQNRSPVVNRGSNHISNQRSPNINNRSNDEYRPSKANIPTFYQQKQMKPKMSIELGLGNNAGNARLNPGQIPTGRRPSALMRSTPKSKRSESFTPKITERRISRTYIENNVETPILSNLHKTNPAKKRPQAPARYLDYLQERKHSSKLLPDYSENMKLQKGPSKADLVARAVNMNESYSRLKDTLKRTFNNSRSASKEKIDSSRFIREKYRVKTTGPKETSPSPEDPLNLTAGYVVGNRHYTLGNIIVGERKGSTSYLSSLNKSGVSFAKSVRPSIAKVVEIPGPKYNLANYKGILGGKKMLDIGKKSPNKKGPVKSLQQSPEKKEEFPPQLQKIELNKILPTNINQSLSTSNDLPVLKINNLATQILTLASERNMQTEIINKTVNTPQNVEKLGGFNGETDLLHEGKIPETKELMSERQLQQPQASHRQIEDPVLKTETRELLNSNRQSTMQDNQAAIGTEREGIKIMVTQPGNDAAQ